MGSGSVYNDSSFTPPVLPRPAGKNTTQAPTPARAGSVTPPDNTSQYTDTSKISSTVTFTNQDDSSSVASKIFKGVTDFFGGIFGASEGSKKAEAALGSISAKLDKASERLDDKAKKTVAVAKDLKTEADLLTSKKGEIASRLKAMGFDDTFINGFMKIVDNKIRLNNTAFSALMDRATHMTNNAEALRSVNRDLRALGVVKDVVGNGVDGFAESMGAGMEATETITGRMTPGEMAACAPDIEASGLMFRSLAEGNGQLMAMVSSHELRINDIIASAIQQSAGERVATAGGTPVPIEIPTTGSPVIVKNDLTRTILEKLLENREHNLELDKETFKKMSEENRYVKAATEKKGKVASLQNKLDQLLTSDTDAAKRVKLESDLIAEMLKKPQV